MEQSVPELEPSLLATSGHAYVCVVPRLSACTSLDCLHNPAAGADTRVGCWGHKRRPHCGLHQCRQLRCSRGGGRALVLALAAGGGDGGADQAAARPAHQRRGPGKLPAAAAAAAGTVSSAAIQSPAWKCRCLFVCDQRFCIRSVSRSQSSIGDAVHSTGEPSLSNRFRFAFTAIAAAAAHRSSYITQYHSQPHGTRCKAALTICSKQTHTAAVLPPLPCRSLRKN